MSLLPLLNFDATSVHVLPLLSYLLSTLLPFSVPAQGSNGARTQQKSLFLTRPHDGLRPLEDPHRGRVSSHHTEGLCALLEVIQDGVLNAVADDGVE